MGKKPDVMMALKTFEKLQSVNVDFGHIANILETVRHNEELKKDALETVEAVETRMVNLKRRLVSLDAQEVEKVEASVRNAELRDRKSLDKKRALEAECTALEERKRNLGKEVGDELAPLYSKANADIRNKKSRIVELDELIRDKTTEVSRLNTALRDFRKQIA